MGSKSNIQTGGHGKIIKHDIGRVIMPVLLATRTFKIRMKETMLNDWGLVNLGFVTNAK